MSDFNALWQGRVGWRSGVIAPSQDSTLWTSVYAVYNADTVGSSSLKTSLYAAYNGESNANDSFGSNNGTAQGGLTYTTGKIGNAFQFNGTNAYVSLPNSSGQFNFDGDFSVSMWFKSSNLSTSRYAIGNYKSGGSNGYGWLLFYSVVGGFAFDLRNGNNINQVRNTQTINTNTWYHVVAVRKMGQIHKLYVNGVDVSAPQTDGNVNNIAGYTANQPMDLGGLSDANAPALCDLDGVNMWNKALTQSEITELYNSGNGAQYITNDFYKPTINDALNLRNGTAKGGLTYGVGKVGTAFQFNGTNSYILLPRHSLRFTNSFSVSLWTYSTANQTGNKGLFSDYYYPGDYGYFSYISTSNKVVVFFKGGYLTNQSFTSNSSLSNNQWNNVVILWDKTNAQWKIFINGVLDYTYTNSNANAIIYQSDDYENRTNIGAINSADSFAGNIFNGQIDAFNVWNRVLTQSEITELYNSANGKQYPN